MLNTPSSRTIRARVAGKLGDSRSCACLIYNCCRTWIWWEPQRKCHASYERKLLPNRLQYRLTLVRSAGFVTHDPTALAKPNRKVQFARQLVLTRCALHPMYCMYDLPAQSILRASSCAGCQASSISRPIAVILAGSLWLWLVSPASELQLSEVATRQHTAQDSQLSCCQVRICAC